MKILIDRLAVDEDFTRRVVDDVLVGKCLLRLIAIVLIRIAVEIRCSAFGFDHLTMGQLRPRAEVIVCNCIH